MAAEIMASKVNEFQYYSNLKPQTKLAQINQIDHNKEPSLLFQNKYRKPSQE